MKKTEEMNQSVGGVDRLRRQLTQAAWATPIISAVVLPAHAQTSQCSGSQRITVSGEISSVGDRDTHRVNVCNCVSGDTLTINLICSDGTLDPVVDVTDPNGTTYFDDDSGAECDAFNSALIMEVPAVNGNWTIVASGFETLSNPTGPYTLEVIVTGDSLASFI